MNYTIKVFNVDYEEVQKWCSDQLGERDVIWDVRGLSFMPWFTFKNESDAVIFSLRWVK